MANITTNHICNEHDHVRVFIPSTKNDIYREGNYVYIKKLGNKYCPVEVLRRYTEAANVNNEPNLPIFRSLRFLDLPTVSNYMVHDYLTQDAEKYSKNRMLTRTWIRRKENNTDYTV